MPLSPKQAGGIAKRNRLARMTLQGAAPALGSLPASVSPIAPPATQGGPTHANVRKPSDQRFRSFCERYAVARAHLLTNDPAKLPEEQWLMVMDAKRFYAMIERAGQNIQPEDGVF